MKTRYILLSVLSLALSQCNPPAPEGIEKLKREMHDRKLKRVTAGAIQENALNFGITLTDSIEHKFYASLERQPKATSCAPIFEQISKEQSSELLATVIRLPFWKTDTNQLDPKLKDLFLAYKYSNDHNQQLETNVQKLADTAFWISKPIVLKNNNCLKCHQFPLNTTVGIYAIRLTRQQVVRHIDIKTLKPK